MDMSGRRRNRLKLAQLLLLWRRDTLTPWRREAERAGDIILIVSLDVFSRHLFRLAKLASILSHDAQLLARVEQALGQLAMIGGEVAVEQSLVSAPDDEAGDVHCHLTGLAGVNDNDAQSLICALAVARLFSDQLVVLELGLAGMAGHFFFFLARGTRYCWQGWRAKIRVDVGLCNISSRYKV